MCGRFSFFIDKDDWTKFTQEELKMQLDLAEDFRNRYNIAPSDNIQTWAPSVKDNQLIYMRRGYAPHYAEDDANGLINARDDKVMEEQCLEEKLP